MLALFFVKDLPVMLQFVMCTRVHVLNVCVEHDGIHAAVHVTILVFQEHLLNLKLLKDQDVIVKCGLLIFFFCYLYCTR